LLGKALRRFGRVVRRSVRKLKKKVRSFRSRKINTFKLGQRIKRFATGLRVRFSRSRSRTTTRRTSRFSRLVRTVSRKIKNFGRFLKRKGTKRRRKVTVRGVVRQFKRSIKVVMKSFFKRTVTRTRTRSSTHTHTGVRRVGGRLVRFVRKVRRFFRSITRRTVVIRKTKVFRKVVNFFRRI
jgi:hypothetical protein